MKKRAGGADRACRAVVPARREPVDAGNASSGRAPGLRQGELLKKTDAKGEYSWFQKFPEFLGGGLAKFYDLKSSFVKFSENGSLPVALPVTTSSRSPTRIWRK